MFEEIKHKNELLAIVVRSSFHQEGIKFFTPNDFSQQLAYISHPTGKKIESHVHNEIIREVTYTKEVLFIRKGKLRIDFFTDDRKYLSSRILSDGDVILLSTGGHGFEVLEDLEMIEVKQGPYAGENDKTRFECKIDKFNFGEDVL